MLSKVLSMGLHELYIVNYCHPDCSPLFSITRLPEADAYAVAAELSFKFKGTAIGRFADFHNYYPRRIRTEKWLFDRFVELGGEPKTEHPLYFVLNGSEYLNDWFDKGEVTKLPLGGIDSKHISFTFGDSMAKMDKPERRDPFTKEALYEAIEAYDGTIDEFFENIEKQWHYIEVQLWSDAYFTPDELLLPSVEGTSLGGRYEIGPIIAISPKII